MDGAPLSPTSILVPRGALGGRRGRAALLPDFGPVCRCALSV